MNQLELNIKEIVFMVAPALPFDSFAKIDDLVQLHGEYGVAMELLCSILEEHKIAINSDIYNKIIGVFVEMQFTPNQVDYYKKHLIHK